MHKEDRKNQVPLLMTLHGQQYENQSFYNVLENRYQTICLPIFKNRNILGSAYGWLVLAGHNGYCLLNPTSLENIELPQLEGHFYYDKCVLSKPPTEPDCHVVFNHSFYMCLSAWRINGEDGFVKASSKEKGRLTAIASFRGGIYGIFGNYEFVTIHLVGETVEGVEFRVFRVDVDGMECVELENIDGLTIFVGYYGNGFCCSSLVTGSKPNSIYYTNEVGRDMYVFDLDDRSIVGSLSCPIAEDNLSVNFWVDCPDILDLEV
ncbi:hypothetical protein PHJA_001337900 [Phtheirospermum japonicum]|uniref:KIB1-4 beta-propeller domain-containing protein n=1 Tax=Phtheirospermum japonicum TaxID=374723 RepID=A0A830C474_9LAMI|nr:hypothetical protein PHJA_001337900 [Phtheirospermum japonicum]